ncbi:MAG TPA: sugar phosphate isomerase/epimerase family protein [bacterium]|nr:sugar phosphate isomerase/epimerase family protein [bacterium]
MKTAIYTGFNCDIPLGQSVSMIRKAGFEAVSIGSRIRHSSYDTAEGCDNIRKLMKQNRLEIDSIHAPCPEGDNLFSIDESERMESVRQCKNALDAALEVDGKIVVIHLIPYNIPEGDTRKRMVEQGKRSVKILAEYAIAKKLKLALENGQKKDYDEVLELFLSEFGDNSIGFCYDSGHENVQGTCFHILKKFGNRLFTTHLHDNRGSDTHLLPYEGNIDWHGFREAIRSLDYCGRIHLESGMSYSQFREPEQFLSEAFKRAETLIP